MRKLIITGQPVTKKNSTVVRCLNGKPLVLPSKAYRAYEKHAIRLLKAEAGQTFSGLIAVRVLYWLKDNRRPDLTNLLQATADILEKAGMITNDRNIVSWDGSRIMGTDRDNPRAEIEITAISNLIGPLHGVKNLKTGA